MPAIAIVLPSLQFSFNQAKFARRAALYFALPLGLMSNAIGYSSHANGLVVSSSLVGLACVVAAATAKQLTPRRGLINAVGCVIMLAASYRSRQLERKQMCGHKGKDVGQSCSSCNGCLDK